MLGATKPPRLPMELIRAMPPAAAAPPNSRVGRVQNKAGETISPAAATHKAISATSGDGVSADVISATPASVALKAPMPRALPLRSHQGGTKVTATSAQIQGRDVTSPTSNPMLVPSSRATWVG